MNTLRKALQLFVFIGAVLSMRAEMAKATFADLARDSSIDLASMSDKRPCRDRIPQKYQLLFEGNWILTALKEMQNLSFIHRANLLHRISALQPIPDILLENLGSYLDSPDGESDFLSNFERNQQYAVVHYTNLVYLTAAKYGGFKSKAIDDLLQEYFTYSSFRMDERFGSLRWLPEQSLESKQKKLVGLHAILDTLASRTSLTRRGLDFWIEEVDYHSPVPDRPRFDNGKKMEFAAAFLALESPHEASRLLSLVISTNWWAKEAGIKGLSLRFVEPFYLPQNRNCLPIDPFYFGKGLFFRIEKAYSYQLRPADFSVISDKRSQFEPVLLNHLNNLFNERILWTSRQTRLKDQPPDDPLKDALFALCGFEKASPEYLDVIERCLRHYESAAADPGLLFVAQNAGITSSRIFSYIEKTATQTAGALPAAMALLRMDSPPLSTVESVLKGAITLDTKVSKEEKDQQRDWRFEYWLERGQIERERLGRVLNELLPKLDGLSKEAVLGYLTTNRTAFSLSPLYPTGDLANSEWQRSFYRSIMGRHASPHQRVIALNGFSQLKDRSDFFRTNALYSAASPDRDERHAALKALVTFPPNDEILLSFEKAVINRTHEDASLLIEIAPKLKDTKLASRLSDLAKNELCSEAVRNLSIRMTDEIIKAENELKKNRKQWIWAKILSIATVVGGVIYGLFNTEIKNVIKLLSTRRTGPSEKRIHVKLS